MRKEKLYIGKKNTYKSKMTLLASKLANENGLMWMVN